MYNPSFFELVIALAVINLWARWLTPRQPAARFVPWVGAIAVTISLLFAAFAVNLEQTQWVRQARGVGFLVCILAIVLLGAWTALSAGKKTASDDEAS